MGHRFRPRSISKAIEGAHWAPFPCVDFRFDERFHRGPMSVRASGMAGKASNKINLTAFDHEFLGDPPPVAVKGATT